MKLLYEKIKPFLVEGICYVLHKGKKKDFIVPLHTHGPRYHEMIYVDYGTAKISLRGSDITVRRGECIFILGGSRHSFKGESGTPFDYLNITFLGNPKKTQRSLFGKSIPVNRKCLELLETLKQESVDEMPYCREIIASCFTELIVRLLRQVKGFATGKISESINCRRYQSEIVNRAIRIISEEYSKPLTLSHLSRAVGIGVSRLRVLLKNETGENFSTLLHKQRIIAAKHLLREEILSLEEISTAVGYRYSAFFFKIFKRLTGMTPKAYSRSLGDPVQKK